MPSPSPFLFIMSKEKTEILHLASQSSPLPLSMPLPYHPSIPWIYLRHLRSIALLGRNPKILEIFHYAMQCLTFLYVSMPSSAIRNSLPCIEKRYPGISDLQGKYLTAARLGTDHHIRAYTDGHVSWDQNTLQWLQCFPWISFPPKQLRSTLGVGASHAASRSDHLSQPKPHMIS